MQRLLLWIVLLTFETHLVYTVQAPVRGPTRAIEGLHHAASENSVRHCREPKQGIGPISPKKHRLRPPGRRT